MLLEGAKMGYQDRYAQYYQQIPVDIKKIRQNGRRLVLGYTSDLDVIIEWNGETFADIISTYLKEDPFLIDGDVIDSMGSFARIVSYYMIHGLGGEIDITNADVCEYLESHFKTAYALGGTCAQGAAALNAVGFPVLVHITDRSKEVCNLIEGPGVEMVTPDGVVPIMKGASVEQPVRHMILQYSKGEKILANGVTYEIPDSNRLILDFDTIHKYLPLDQCFLDYCETFANNMLVYSVSGFNGILDDDIIRKKVNELATHYKTVKNQNPNCVIYLEDAHYLNFNMKRIVFDRLAGVIDILGMNEEELIDHTKKLGFQMHRDDLASVLEGLDFMLEKYPMQGIVLHTKDYSMYYGNQIKGVDFIKGLTLGNLVAGTRARTGRYGSFEDCGETIRLPLSPAGIIFTEQLANMNTKKHVWMVPSRYIDCPNCTIGLGDTFMAGFLISFVV
jgi:ADP-dependent phosphofructokinase/glucokinase